MSEPPATREPLLADEIRDRAAAGAAVLGARNTIVFVLGIAANVALARLLAPHDFGLIALGSVLLVAGSYLIDGGMAAALIRRSHAPERVELEAVTGLQAAAAAVFALVAAGVAAAFGDDGLVIAAMVGALPLSALRTAAAIVLERQLLYRPIAFVDLVEAISYYVWALGAVALGFGVWGLASAFVVRALAGVATMARVGPLGLVRPRWSWSRVRPLLAFGAKLQAVTVVSMARDHGINVVVAAIAGVTTLGVWSLAYRILQIPNLLILSAARVSYPAMSRLLGAREDPRAAIERGIGVMATFLGVVLVAIVGFAPAGLPPLLGDGWGDVPAALLWSALGILLGAPVVVGSIGYLYATDHAGTVLRGVTWQTVTWLAVTLPLLPVLGAPSVGVGSIPAGVVIAAIVGRRTARLTGASIARALAPPVLAAVVAGAAGWLLADRGPETVPQGMLGLAAGELILLTGLLVAARGHLAAAWALARRGLRSFGGHGAASTGAPAA